MFIEMTRVRTRNSVDVSGAERDCEERFSKLTLEICKCEVCDEGIAVRKGKHFS